MSARLGGRPFALVTALAFFLGACTATPPPTAVPITAPAPAASETDDAVDFILLQMNDVYEIGPVAGGRQGGLARVATVRKRLLQEDADVITLIAGDFLSPSAMGTATVDGERLDGRQMVATLNALGLDWATYGNHELDLKEGALRARLSEAEFPMVVANVTDASGAPMPNTVETVVFTVGEDDPRRLRVGLTGVVLTDNDPDYVTLSDPLAALAEAVESLRDDTDVVIALTHLDMAEDVRAVETIPGIDMSLGGHEHQNIQAWRGPDRTPIFKADANARTVYVHRVRVAADGVVSIRSHLLPVDASIPDDPATAAVVDEWTRKAFDGFRAQGFEPEERVATTDLVLDGKESSVRNYPTELTRLIAQGMAHGAGVDVAIYNSGSIRIDDEIPVGPVTQYDVIRVLPFGGTVQTVEIRGDVLRRALDTGLERAGDGGYLQTTPNVTRTTGGAWVVAGQGLDPHRIYRVAVSDYLASGRQSGLEFLNPSTDGFTVVEADGPDVRQTTIAELRRRWP